jgi:hypothetical protein
MDEDVEGQAGGKRQRQHAGRAANDGDDISVGKKLPFTLEWARQEAKQDMHLVYRAVGKADETAVQLCGRDFTVSLAGGLSSRAAAVWAHVSNPEAGAYP